MTAFLRTFDTPEAALEFALNSGAGCEVDGCAVWINAREWIDLIVEDGRYRVAAAHADVGDAARRASEAFDNFTAALATIDRTDLE